jgi:hypothetical protein
MNREFAEYWIARSSLVKPGDDSGVGATTPEN